MYRQSEKNLFNSNISSTCLHNMANFGPLTAEIHSGLLGHPSKFQRVSRLGFVTAATLLTNKTLHDLWPSSALVHCISTFGGSCPPNGILPAAKFTLRPSLAFSNIGSVTAWHSSKEYKEWNYVAKFG